MYIGLVLRDVIGGEYIDYDKHREMFGYTDVRKSAHVHDSLEEIEDTLKELDVSLEFELITIVSAS